MRPLFYQLHYQELAVQATCQIFQDPDWSQRIDPSSTLCGAPYFATELAVGGGKITTYIKTIYELHRQQGWQKYIIMVPNSALHNQVSHALQDTAAKLSLDYHTKAHFFSYDSTQPNNLRQFLEEPHLSVLIINAQAFNSRNEGMRKIREQLDAFGSRRPLELLAQLRPVIILDEPQRIFGNRHHATITQQCLAEFNPRFILGYASRHQSSPPPIYRFSTQDSIRQGLVKRVVCQTVEPQPNTPPETSPPNDLWPEPELALRRQQIRQTIRTHLSREADLFARGIKVLSVFFIDDVSKFRQYEDLGEAPGVYAQIFEQEYAQVVAEVFAAPLAPSSAAAQEVPTTLPISASPTYRQYLQRFSPGQVYQGYFSINKLTRRLKNSPTNAPGDDTTAVYDLIHHDHARLLSLDEPTRFIFTHSGLHEGWENPNIFQICPLHRSSSDLRRQCELDRGLPICVDQFGARQDRVALGDKDFATVNQLTVVADPDYANFLKMLS